jgi:hypothetical protein
MADEPRPPARAPEILGPAALTLPELADRINHEHKQLKDCVIRGARHAVEAGKQLWEAKRKAGRGNWLDWLAENCEFSERTAQLYMKLADSLPQVANPQRIADLSLNGAIEMLEGLKSPTEQPIPTGRRLNKRTDKVAEAIKTAPLAILERAWAEAEEQERNIFRQKIGAA